MSKRRAYHACLIVARATVTGADAVDFLNDYSAPAIRGNCAAIEPRLTGSAELVSKYFIGGMMPELANPVQQPETIIEIRPYRGGWQYFEAPQTEFLLRGVPQKSNNG
jgi:hypothetical protein